jgi:hypothetical protein
MLGSPNPGGPSVRRQVGEVFTQSSDGLSTFNPFGTWTGAMLDPTAQKLLVDF